MRRRRTLTQSYALKQVLHCCVRLVFHHRRFDYVRGNSGLIFFLIGYENVECFFYMLIIYTYMILLIFVCPLAVYRWVYRLKSKLSKSYLKLDAFTRDFCLETNGASAVGKRNLFKSQIVKLGKGFAVTAGMEHNAGQTFNSFLFTKTLQADARGIASPHNAGNCTLF